MSSRRAAWAWGIAGSVLAVAARAPADVPAPSAPALSSVAERIVSQIAPTAKTPVLIVPAPLKSEEAAPRAAELAAKVAALVAGKLGPGAAAGTEPLSLAAARTAGRKAGAIVYLQAEIARGEVRVTGDAYRVPRNAWDRVVDASPPPMGHAFASARIDAEVRSFLAPLPIVAGTVSRVAADDRDILALACGDPDGDGNLQLLTVGRRRVALGRIREARFTPTSVALWSDLSPVAAAPLREPFAGASIASGRPAASRVEAGITDRAHGARLDDQLRAIASIAGFPIEGGDGRSCAAPGPDGRGLLLAACTAEDPKIAPKAAAAPIDAIAVGSFVTAQGTAFTVQATRDQSTGEVTLASLGTATILPSAGAQIALADLDQDGDPEIIASADVLDPAADTLAVSSFHPGGAVHERLRLPVPSGIRAITTCPSEGAGASIVLATGDGLWLVR